MYVELRLHGRGGQGIVTASEMIVEAATIEGFFGQSIPIFGAERRGAPVSASARISDTPIRRHSQICNPDMVGVFDPLFLLRAEVTAGLKQGGTIIANHHQQREVDGFRVHVVDATRIAIENGLMVAGWAVVNTAMLGAISRVLGNVSREAVEKVVRMRWSGELGDKNISAALRAYEEVS